MPRKNRREKSGMVGDSPRPLESFDPPFRAVIRRSLLAWYRRHRRDLPWRQRQHDGYAQLVAELMLQQTQVGTVIPYYHKFMTKFPDAEALAAADLDEVLALWSGLGYYSRARNLHKAAAVVVDDYGGQVPSDVDELQSLPGVGRYTAGAVASIAYGVRAPVLDGNVIRVLLRLAGWAVDGQSPAVRQQLWRWAEQLLPANACGDFNQAMMELGATICRAANPQCRDCPISRRCAAYAQGRTNEIPAPRVRKPVSLVEVACAVLRCQDAVLFVRRPERGLWGGLWELPAEIVGPNESQAVARQRLKRKLPVGHRLDRRFVGPVERRLTHRVVHFYLYRGKMSQKGVLTAPGPGRRWVGPGELADLGISSAVRAVLERAW